VYADAAGESSSNSGVAGAVGKHFQCYFGSASLKRRLDHDDHRMGAGSGADAGVGVDRVAAEEDRAYLILSVASHQD
jgi:hypothetical protein